jgi:outer membrane protein OmpA-like peptidoglycan-associated protein
MQKSRRCGPSAGPDLSSNRRALMRRSWFVGALLALLGGCAPAGQNPPVATTAPPPVTTAAPPTVATPAPPPVPPVPFPAAVLNAANAVFSGAAANASPVGQRQVVVIDPLVNGVTGEQSAATRQIRESIVGLANERYPQFDIQPFSAATVSKAPYVMVGTFTPVNAQGQTAGTREAYRFCLVMVDLRAGKTVAKGVARARPDGVDSTPVGFFQDSPAWTNDASIKSYIDTCQATKVGDTINPTYLNGILTASIISEAIDAYDANRFRDAMELYLSAAKTPAGNQLRVYNGLYLTNWKLGHRDQAEEAFGRVVDYGLTNNTLGVKILFRPGSTGFESDPQTSGPYDMWLRQIASRSANRNACLQVTGNSSPSGAAALNDLLSQLRAEYVKGRLETDAPALRGHVISTGVGAKNNLIGTGADNLSDALDRRVEFKVIPTC